MVGPSGAGKTRLLTHWANRDILNDWEAIDVNSSTNIDWSNWSPQRRTLISIDYIYGYDKVISDIIARMEKADLTHSVRLLLLDHVTPDTVAELLKDPRWGFEDKKAEDFTSMEERLFFKEAPLKLHVSDDEDEDYDIFLSKIICAVVYRGDKNPFEKIDDPAIQRGLKYLRETTGARQPLFAALVGDAIKNGQKDGENAEGYKTLNRRALIAHYLQGKTRLTWLMEDSERGTWAACFIAAATTQRGVKFETLRQAIPKEHSHEIDRDYKGFKSLCNGVVSGNDKNTLKAFEPDILGETHFLLLLKEIEENLPYYQDKLPALIAAEAHDSSDKSASEFVAFTARLARNLSNDDQADDETQAYWQRLKQFLTPEKFLAGSPLRWATSIACFEIYLILNDKEQVELADILLNRIDPEGLYSPPERQVQVRHIWLAIKYFSLREKEGGSIPPSLIELLALWDRNRSLKYTALILSLWAKSSTVANYLVDQGSNLKAEGVGSWTALMVACRYDLEAVALKLVEKNANLEAQDENKWTALMFACRYDLEAVALKLVEKNANLEAQDSEDWTALMIACRYDQEAVALKLVEKNANLEAQNSEGWTALMFACCYDQKAVALKLVEKSANLEAQNSGGWTALMFAVFSIQKSVVRALLEKKVSTDDICEHGETICTALGLARDGGCSEIIGMLEAEGALEIPPHKSAS